MPYLTKLNTSNLSTLNISVLLCLGLTIGCAEPQLYSSDDGADLQPNYEPAAIQTPAPTGAGLSRML